MKILDFRHINSIGVFSVFTKRTMPIFSAGIDVGRKQPRFTPLGTRHELPLDRIWNCGGFHCFVKTWRRARIESKSDVVIQTIIHQFYELFRWKNVKCLPTLLWFEAKEHDGVHLGKARIVLHGIANLISSLDGLLADHEMDVNLGRPGIRKPLDQIKSLLRSWPNNRYSHGTTHFDESSNLIVCERVRTIDCDVWNDAIIPTMLKNIEQLWVRTNRRDPKRNLGHRWRERSEDLFEGIQRHVCRFVSLFVALIAKRATLRAPFPFRNLNVHDFGAKGRPRRIILFSLAPTSKKSIGFPKYIIIFRTPKNFTIIVFSYFHSKNVLLYYYFDCRFTNSSKASVFFIQQLNSSYVLNLSRISSMT